MPTITDFTGQHPALTVHRADTGPAWAAYLPAAGAVVFRPDLGAADEAAAVAAVTQQVHGR